MARKQQSSEKSTATSAPAKKEQSNVIATASSSSASGSTQPSGGAAVAGVREMSLKAPSGESPLQAGRDVGMATMHGGSTPQPQGASSTPADGARRSAVKKGGESSDGAARMQPIGLGAEIITESSSSSEFEAIAFRAWQIWQEEGCPEGRDKEHWLRAEKEMSRRSR